MVERHFIGGSLAALETLLATEPAPPAIVQAIIVGTSVVRFALLPSHNSFGNYWYFG
jgi:hypothetical protein